MMSTKTGRPVKRPKKMATAKSESMKDMLKALKEEGFKIVCMIAVHPKKNEMCFGWDGSLPVEERFLILTRALKSTFRRE